MSMFNYLGSDDVEEGLLRLKTDLQLGTWYRKYSDIISHETYDVGCRFLHINIS